MRDHFPLRPRGIIDHLKLLRPIYRETARHGHFGRELPGFTWEHTDRARALAGAAKKLGAASGTAIVRTSAKSPRRSRRLQATG